MEYKYEEWGPYYELARALSSPIDWELICKNTEIASVLNFLWFKTVQLNKVDNEAMLFEQESWLPDLESMENFVDPSEIARVLGNIDTWRTAAVQSYTRHWRRFSKLRVATPDDYPKHYMSRDSTDEEVAKESRLRGQSVLYPRFAPSWQLFLVWAALTEVWLRNGGLDADDNEETRASRFRQIFAQQNLHVLANLTFPIGAVNGKPSSLVHLDFDFSTPLVHLYPDLVASPEVDGFHIDIPGGDFSPDGKYPA